MENMIEPLYAGIDRFANLLLQSATTRDTNPATINEMLDDIIKEYDQVDELTVRVFLEKLAEKNVAVIDDTTDKFANNRPIKMIAESLLLENEYEMLKSVMALPADAKIADMNRGLCAQLIQFCYVTVGERYDRDDITDEEEAIYHYWFDVILPSLQRRMRAAGAD
jgi:hypothetical protein